MLIGGRPARLAYNQFTRGSLNATPVPPSQQSRNISDSGIVSILSRAAWVVSVAFFSSVSYQAETERIAAGSGFPLSRNLITSPTAKLPPTEWPAGMIFSGR